MIRFLLVLFYMYILKIYILELWNSLRLTILVAAINRHHVVVGNDKVLRATPPGYSRTNPSTR